MSKLSLSVDTYSSSSRPHSPSNSPVRAIPSPTSHTHTLSKVRDSVELNNTSSNVDTYNNLGKLKNNTENAPAFLKVNQNNEVKVEVEADGDLKGKKLAKINSLKTDLNTMLEELTADKKDNESYEIYENSIKDQTKNIFNIAKAIGGIKLDELNSTSITPRTKGEGFKTIKNLQSDALLNKLEQPLSSSLELYIEEIKNLQDDNAAYITVYQHTDSKDNVTKLGPEVRRYVINPYSINDLNFDSTKVHAIELQLFLIAIEYLQEKIDAIEYNKAANFDEYPNNVVLLDIFSREDNNSIKKHDIIINHPDVHTICLWKRAGNEFSIIDPNESKFSKFIGKFLQEALTGYKKITIEKDNITIYSNSVYEKNHPSHTTPKVRDCVDIAVKIAFELNELQKSAKKPSEAHLIFRSYISNYKKTSISEEGIGYLSVFDEKQQLNIKELHSSDKDDREKARSQLQNFKKNYTKLSQNLDLKKVSTLNDLCNLNLNFNELKKFYKPNKTTK